MSVQKALSPIDLAREPGFAVGGAEVRPSTREVLAGETRHVLEPRVMQVLVSLAREPGEVVSRDDLIAACWGGRIVGEDAVQRAVALLRRLGEQTGAFAIETIARVGYRLDALGSRAKTRDDAATIAVLPFVNISSDPEQGYFADGLAEELMSHLARLEGLRVAGRTSAFAFRNQVQDLRTIGQSLGVAHILEGSVRKAGDRLRITAQLVKCADGYNLWSQTFDRELGDVFAIQEEVARAVTAALGLTLGVGVQAPDYGGTTNFEAFDHFLKGRFLAAMGFSGAFSRADHLRRAVAIDPGYAAAWANLSTLLAYAQSFLSPEEARRIEPERTEAAKKAIALAPDLPAANVAEGYRLADERSWSAATRTFMHAVSAARDPASEGIVGAYLTDIGLVREGLAYRERARDSDPLSVGWVLHVLNSYLTLGLLDRFDAEYRRSEELEGRRGGIEFARLRRLLAVRAEADEIAAQFDRCVIASEEYPLFDALAGRHRSRDDTLGVLRESLDGSPGHLVTVAQFAGLYGDHDLAIQALVRAAPDLRLVHLQSLWGPELIAARRDRRFKDLVHQLRLPQYWRESGRWPEFARPSDDDFDFVG